MAAGLFATLVGSALAQPCQRLGEVDPGVTVRNSDLVVVATAAEYQKKDRAESIIRFEVLEVVKGSGDVPRELSLRGRLSDTDDFNDHPSPYRFVRPGGRGGSCYADTYKQGASFLLLLKTRGDEYTVEWDALAPVNEQLHSLDDPWVLWVQNRVKSDKGQK